MTEDPLIDDLRAASHFGCRVLEPRYLRWATASRDA
jgi:hypothetical protein